MHDDAPGRIAYLVSQYPALSHVFVETEVGVLRALGWQVSTFSVRRSALPAHAETASTPALQQRGPGGLMFAVASLALKQPAAVFEGLRAAVRWGRARAAKQRLWQFFYLAEAAVLHRAMRDLSLRHVHVHFANNSADIARLAVVLGQAIDGPGSWTWSVAVHGPTEFEDAAGFDLKRKVASAAFVACITDFSRSQVMRYVDPASWSKLHVVRMGVAADLTDRGEGPQAATGGGGEGDDGSLRVLFVGRLVPEKGPHVLLDAADALARASASGSRRTDVVVIGAGPLRSSLEERAASLHPGAAVRFLGGLPHDRLLPWYDWAHVFCLPSFSEGLPVVLMEAMAHRLPVVTTPIAGVPELVVHDDTGVLVAPGRSDALAAALGSLADDPDRRRRLGSRGHDAVRSRHSAAENGILLAGLLARTATKGR